MKKNILNNKQIETHAFIHQTACNIDNTYGELFEETNKVKKIELAILMSTDALLRVTDNLSKLKNVKPGYIFKKFSNTKDVPCLLYQHFKESNEKYTEIKKTFINYNNTVYLVRIYRFICSKHFKLEITKIALGTGKKYLNKHRAINGMLTLMKKIAKDAERYALPHYMHNGTYQTIEEFTGVDARFLGHTKDGKQPEEY